MLEIDHDDTDDEGTSTTPLTSRAALASVALEAALGRTGRRMITAGAAATVVITVPTDAWAAPVMSALLTMNPAIRTISGHEKPIAQAAEGREATRVIGLGALVVGVSDSPDRLLPDVLVTTATHRYEILSPTSRIVRLAMNRCLGGRAPASLRGMDLAGLDFDVLCACMPTGITKKAAVERLHRATAKPANAAPGGLPYPTLEEAVEYGAARDWGIALKSDIADLRSGKISWPELDRGAVLEGPPGTGKSTFARILATACDLPLVLGSISELFASSDGNLDGVIKAQRRLFDQAAAAAPCILFIDELNALPDPARLSSRGRDWWLPVIYDFFLLLDSAMSSRDGMIVLGATNIISDISPALLRPGRLERSLHVGIPDAEGLARILRTQLRGDLAKEDLLPLAKVGRGATAAMAMEWVRAARRASRTAGRRLRIEDLATQVMPPDARTADERLRIATHEAGHGVVGAALGLTLKELTIVRVGDTDGRAFFEEQEETGFGLADFERTVVMLLGGMAAETELLGRTSTGSGGGPGSDLARATWLMSEVRTAFGMAGSLVYLPPADAAVLLASDTAFRQAIDADLHRLYDEARQLVRIHESQIRATADRLLVDGRIDGRRSCGCCWRPITASERRRRQRPPDADPIAHHEHRCQP